MDREAAALDSPMAVIDGEGATLALTPGQLNFVHRAVFARESGNVEVTRDRNNIVVRSGDERHHVSITGDVVRTEGFDPFDNDWKEK